MVTKALLICLVPILLLGCSREPQDDEARAKVRELLEAYRIDDDEEREQARDRMAALGDKAVPTLTKLLRSEKDFSIQQNALYALVDLASEASLSALLEALDGRTRVEPDHAVIFVCMFVATHKWSPEEVRLLPDANRIIGRYVESEDQPFWLIRFASTLSVVEAIPRLRKVAAGDDLDDALQAARAVYAITGERVEVKLHKPQFVRQQVDDGLFVRRWSKPLEDPVGPFCLTRSASGEPAVIFAPRDTKEQTTQIHVVDHAGTRSDAFSLAGTFGPMLPVPQRAPTEDVWLVGLLKKDRRVRSSVAIALDAHGEERWRVESPSREFLSLAWMSPVGKRPVELILSYGMDTDGFVGVGIDGRNLWTFNTDVYTESLGSDECLPEHFVGLFQGSVRLFSRDGSQIGETSSRVAHACDAALVPMADESVAVAALLELRSSNEYHLALLDAGMTAKWTCKLSEPSRHLGVIYSGCNGDVLVVVLGKTGTLYAVDRDGVLHWTGRAFDADPLEFSVPRMAALPATDSHPAVVVTLCEKEMVLWECTLTADD